MKQIETVDSKALHVTDFDPCKFNHCGVALPLFIRTTCAKSGCKAIKRALILFDLENPISSTADPSYTCERRT